jgi:hypothetical protein
LNALVNRIVWAVGLFAMPLLPFLPLLETEAFLLALALFPEFFALEEGFGAAAVCFLCVAGVDPVCASPLATPPVAGIVIARKAHVTIAIRIMLQPLNFASFLSQPTLPL